MASNRKRGRPAAPDGTDEAHAAAAIDQAIRNPADDAAQVLGTAAVLERCHALEVDALPDELQQALDAMPPDAPARAAITAAIEAQTSGWSEDERGDYSRLKPVFAELDHVTKARAEAPRGRGAHPVSPSWQDAERHLLAGTLRLPGSQATLERSRRRARGT